MRAWFALTGADLLTRDPAEIAGRLAAAQAHRGFAGTVEQQRAWEAEIDLLRTAIAVAGGQAWTIAFEYELLRLERRIDVVILTDRTIVCLEFKTSDGGPAAMRDAEDYALDLRDFHEGSRLHPILPVLVVGSASTVPAWTPPLFWDCVLPPARCGGAALGDLLKTAVAAAPAATLPLDAGAWLDAAYRPVPGIVEAAAHLFARQSVANLAAARADAANLNRTTASIRRAIAVARQAEQRVVVFVTGIPGAGKTLCGLNVVFGEDRAAGSAFLTGNAPLVAVLREALACDRAGIDLGLGPSNDPRGRTARGRLRQARRETAGFLQNVHQFLADNADRNRPPPAERIVVFDEAQRAWNAAQATRHTPRRNSTLSMSEPAHMLDIMGRHQGFAAVIALIGNGQEINTGEAGLAEWGRVLDGAAGWKAVAAQRALAATDPAQRLVDGPRAWLTPDDDLDLAVSMRSVRDSRVAAWVDAVLTGNRQAARALAEAPGLAFRLTRSLDAARVALRGMAQGRRRVGFVRSSGARRLRGEGFDAQLVGSNEPVAWFLERWPDIRASDALETAATEYACQGLELDYAGLAWGGDLLRIGNAWLPQRFSGHRWQTVRGADETRFIVNTYRVLLTRARYETVIWLPPGSPSDNPFHDRTRPARQMDDIADFLTECGARPLDAPQAATVAGIAQQVLL